MGIASVVNHRHGVVDDGIAIGDFWDEGDGDDNLPNEIFACVVACSPVSSIIGRIIVISVLGMGLGQCQQIIKRMGVEINK